MKLYKFFILFNILIFLSSCGAVKEGFKNQKKNSSDEFLVEKKQPLIMPPNFNDLPIPEEENSNKKQEKNDFKSLISKNENNEDQYNDGLESKNLEELLLDKIKNK